jgi:hypothetical protein
MIRPTVVSICILVGALGIAGAAPKVALTVEGDDKGRVREAVVDALEGDELTLVSEKQTLKAMTKVGEVSELSEKQLKKLAKDLSADAILHAKLGNEGKRKVLKFRFYVDGKSRKGFSMLFTRAENTRDVANKLRSKKYKDGLRDKVVAKLAVIAPADDDDDDDEPVKKVAQAKKNGQKNAGKTAKNGQKNAGKTGKNGTKVAKRADDDEDEEDEDEKPAKARTAKVVKKQPKTVAKKPVASEEADDEEEEDDDEEDEGASKRGKRTAARDADDDGELGVTARAPRGEAARAANRAAIRLDVGGSFSRRSLGFTFRRDLDPGQRPPAFAQNGVVPGARFELDVYPLAFSNGDGALAGLGVGVEYDKVVSSKVQAIDGPEEGKVATVNQQIYTASLRYRIAFGKKPTSPTTTLGLGYGRRTFRVNNVFMDRANLDLPDTDYKYIAPLVAFRLPFTKTVALFGAGEAMLIRDAGPIQEPVEYGRAKVFGIDATAGIDIVFNNRFALRLAGELTQIGYTFVGAGGERSNNRDGDPTTLDVGGALDRSLGGSATLAVLY